MKLARLFKYKRGITQNHARPFAGKRYCEWDTAGNFLKCPKQYSVVELYLYYMRSIFVCCITVFLALTSCIREASLSEEEVIAVIKRFDQGWSTKNMKMVDSVLAPSYIYFTQSGGTFGRKNLVQTAGSPEYILESVERSAYFVQIYGNTAVVSTRWKGKGIYKEARFNEVQRCSITIIKRRAKVEILSEHCTPIKLSRMLH